MKISRLRKDMFSVMCNEGFSGITMLRDGIKIELPKALINPKTGLVKARVNGLLNELTRENIIILQEQYKVKFEIA